ncbi:MAG: tRNA (adenosine(37)-N6)-threonylcarbamoyltransferase complex ATPase subunit type 1 TsaE, partial [Candidatus Spechtbacteria bacterium]|nr:tRNA (adenosine(37)-N6)-threonylcarbamoyltransferase complex ATPase subunit type 1 TsaE [Candidatus Spechtbacteria bacterium]
MERAKVFLKEALLDAEAEKSLIFCLTGELGAGKTYFTKGLASALGITDIRSPTFVLMKKFIIKSKGSLDEGKNKKYFYHIDCYRVHDEKDARNIGLDKMLEDSRAIFAIEWAERIQAVIPRPYWKVKFRYEGENKRKIEIEKVE